MVENCSLLFLKCAVCNYETNKKYNLERHQNAKHNNIISDKNGFAKTGKIVHPNGKIVHPKRKIVHPNEKIVHHLENICKKCNKTYKTLKSLIKHEQTCKGIDDLTCPRCMISFSSRSSKSNHIKRNNCKPRSIIYARKTNLKNETINYNTINNIESQYNIGTQNNITNNIYVNNYGNERIDYLNYEKMLEIFKKAYDIPSLLTKEIHFNEEFPENNNIKDSDKNNYALVKMKEEYILEDLNTLAEELVKKKSTQIQKFAIENKEEICTNIETQKYQDMVELLLNFILLKEPLEHYKNQIKKIKDLIKNN
jgi:uncharacterized C2H2 Zn-finger protein